MYLSYIFKIYISFNSQTLLNLEFVWNLKLLIHWLINDILLSGNETASARKYVPALDFWDSTRSQSCR